MPDPGCGCGTLWWSLGHILVQLTNDLYVLQGNLGILDASTQKYRTVMRSHSDHVIDVSVNKVFSSYLISCSEDRTIRVWDLPECTQVHSRAEKHYYWMWSVEHRHN